INVFKYFCWKRIRSRISCRNRLFWVFFIIYSSLHFHKPPTVIYSKNNTCTSYLVCILTHPLHQFLLYYQKRDIPIIFAYYNLELSILRLPFPPKNHIPLLIVYIPISLWLLVVLSIVRYYAHIPKTN